MVNDSRNSPASDEPQTSSASQDKRYETFSVPATPKNAHSLPSATKSTAGGKPTDTGLLQALKSIEPKDFKEVHKKPCHRDALLTGIGSGFGIGGVRAIMGGKSPLISHGGTHS